MKNSIPDVKTLWETSGPRIRKELYYIAMFQKGELVYESAARKCDLFSMELLWNLSWKR